MKRIFLLSLIALMIPVTMPAAKITHTITGKVVEKSNGKALPFATIALLDNSSKIITGTTSLEDGSFRLVGQSDEECIVKVSFIGYKDTTFTVKQPGNGQPVNLGTIGLSVDAVALNSAVVTARVPVIEQKLDKIIMNVSEAVSTQGSNAMDILKKAPGVSVDPSGNILLNGTSVQVWIDGRPSNLSGQELEALLSGTDGSTIDKIEIIAHPSSRYDASGAGGIINIRTKKNFAQGINGSLRGSYNIAKSDKFYHGTDGTLNLNYRADKSNTSVTLSPRYNQHYEKISTSTNMGSSFVLDGLSDLWYNGSGTTMRLTHDYFANKKNIFGFIVTGMLSDGKSGVGQNSGSWLYNSGALVEETKTVIDGDERFDYINTNLNYTHTFKDNHEITINADYGYYDITKNSGQENIFTDNLGDIVRDPNIFRSNSLQYINIFSFRVDYEQILWGKYKFESGIKLARSITDNNLKRDDFINGTWSRNNQLSSLFKYNEDINAVYLSAARQINPKISAKAGLRAEITDAKGEWVSADTVTRKHYINLFPTLFLGYNPNKDLRFGLSYTLRVRRPNFRQLNPFRIYIDATNAVEGNPDLDPQFSNQFSLSLGIKRHLNISLIGQFTNKAIIQSPYFNQQTGEKLIVWENFGTQNFTGAAVSVTEYPVTKWMNFNLNLFMANLSNTSGDFKSQSLFSQGYMNTTFLLPKNYKVEVIGTFQSGLPYGYFTVKPSGEVTLGFKKGFMENRGNLSVMFNDIFNTQQSRVELRNRSVEEYTLTNDYKSQRITVTLSYRFGQSKAMKQRKVGELEEGTRVGTSN